MQKAALLLTAKLRQADDCSTQFCAILAFSTNACLLGVENYGTVGIFFDVFSRKRQEKRNQAIYQRYLQQKAACLFARIDDSRIEQARHRRLGTGTYGACCQAGEKRRYSV